MRNSPIFRPFFLRRRRHCARRRRIIIVIIVNTRKHIVIITIVHCFIEIVNIPFMNCVVRMPCRVCTVRAARFATDFSSFRRLRVQIKTEKVTTNRRFAKIVFVWKCSNLYSQNVGKTAALCGVTLLVI